MIVLSCKVGRTSPPTVFLTSTISVLSPRHRSPSNFHRQAQRKANRDSQQNNIDLKESCIATGAGHVNDDEMMILSHADAVANVGNGSISRNEFQ